MKALRSMTVLSLLLAGCTHFPKVPFTKTVAKHTLTLSHTRLCAGDTTPIEVRFSPAEALTYAVVNEADETVSTGPLSDTFELPVKDLPMNRYKLVVTIPESDVLDANFEVARCVYY